MPAESKQHQTTRRITVCLSLVEYERYQAYCEQTCRKKSTFADHLIKQHLDAVGFPEQRPLFDPVNRKQP